jgi:DHA2 family multidrug resistance protein
MMMGMVIGGRVINSLDGRHLMVFGLMLNVIALFEMTNFSLTMGEWPFIWTGVVQGLGIGLVFVSVNILSYDTLPLELRSEAAAIANAIRTFGSSLGISIVFMLLIRNSQKNMALLSENVTITNEMMHSPHLPAMWDLATEQGRAMMASEMGRQAQMMAYITDFQYILIATICIIPIVFLIKRQKKHDIS